MSCLERSKSAGCPAGCIAQTCVEGDMDTARGIALARLAQYLSGDNRDGVSLDAERPVVQQRNAPGEWLVSVRLPAIQHAAAAPAPRGASIWIVPQDAATLAVVKVNGGPCEQAIARAEATVAAALEHTRWIASGACGSADPRPWLAAAVRGQLRAGDTGRRTCARCGFANRPQGACDCGQPAGALTHGPVPRSSDFDWLGGLRRDLDRLQSRPMPVRITSLVVQQAKRRILSQMQEGDARKTRR